MYNDDNSLHLVNDFESSVYQINGKDLDDLVKTAIAYVHFFAVIFFLFS